MVIFWISLVDVFIYFWSISNIDMEFNSDGCMWNLFVIKLAIIKKKLAWYIKKVVI